MAQCSGQIRVLALQVDISRPEMMVSGFQGLGRLRYCFTILLRRLRSVHRAAFDKQVVGILADGGTRGIFLQSRVPTSIGRIRRSGSFS